MFDFENVKIVVANITIYVWFIQKVLCFFLTTNKVYTHLKFALWLTWTALNQLFLQKNFFSRCVRCILFRNSDCQWTARLATFLFHKNRFRDGFSDNSKGNCGLMVKSLGSRDVCAFEFYPACRRSKTFHLYGTLTVQKFNFSSFDGKSSDWQITWIWKTEQFNFLKYVFYHLLKIPTAGRPILEGYTNHKTKNQP